MADDDREAKKEYDFSGAERGKYYDYRASAPSVVKFEPRKLQIRPDGIRVPEITADDINWG